MDFLDAVRQPTRQGKRLLLAVMLFWVAGLLALIPVLGFFVSLAMMALIFAYWYQHYTALAKKTPNLPEHLDTQSFRHGVLGVVIRLVYVIPGIIIALLFLWTTISRMLLVGKIEWMAQTPDPLVLIMSGILLLIFLACDLFGNAAFLWYAKTRAMSAAWDFRQVFATASNKRFFLSWLQAVGYYISLLIVASFFGVVVMRDLGMWSAILFQTFLNALVLVFSTSTLMLLMTGAFVSTVKNR